MNKVFNKVMASAVTAVCALGLLSPTYAEETRKGPTRFAVANSMGTLLVANNETQAVEVYDEETQSWKDFPSMTEVHFWNTSGTLNPTTKTARVRYAATETLPVSEETVLSTENATNLKSSADYFNLYVIDGTGYTYTLPDFDSETKGCAESTVKTITADAPSEGMDFDKWVIEPGAANDLKVEVEDPTNPTTNVIIHGEAYDQGGNVVGYMYGGSRIVRATYKVHEHTWGDYQYDENSHYRFCTKCGVAHQQAHQYVTTIEAKEPTCTENGNTEEVKCEVCGRVEKASQKIWATGHKKPQTWTTVKEATETQEGLLEKRCEVCNEVVETKTINKLQGAVSVSSQTTPSAAVTNSKLEISNDTLNSLLTEEEKENGVEVNLKVYQEPRIPQTEKDTLFTNAKKELGSENVNGEVLSISLKKDNAIIREVNGGVSISLNLGDNLINKDSKVTRKYTVVRQHRTETGAVEYDVLPCTFDANTNTLTFTTDKFSLYAVVYADTTNAVVTPGTNNTTNTNTVSGSGTPSTGIHTDVVGFAGIAGIALVLAGLLVVFKKKYQ